MEVQTKPRTQSPPALILWDVIEEHFNEAEFLFEEWESALRSPQYNLTELGETIENRLEAHLDGLLIGGKEVAARILMPELENSSEPVRATVASLVLLFAEEESRGRVLAAVQETEGPLQQALIRALVLSSVERLDATVLEHFRGSGSDAEKAILMEILTGRGIDPGESLRPCLDSQDPRLVGAALEAARRFARRELMAPSEKHMRSGHPRVRASALKTSLALGSLGAWTQCMQWAETGNAADPDLLPLIALLGRPDDHRVLFKELEQPAHLERILWTLAFCGTVEAGDACLAYLQNKDERVAKVAADALGWIGGFNLNEDEYQAPEIEPAEDEMLPPFGEDDLDADLQLNGVDELPVPNTQAIADWWKKNRIKFSPKERYLRGEMFSPTALIHTIRDGCLWRRHNLALGLSVWTGGQQHISTDAFSSRQSRQMNTFDTSKIFNSKRRFT